MGLVHYYHGKVVCEVPHPQQLVLVAGYLISKKTNIPEYILRTNTLRLNSLSEDNGRSETFKLVFVQDPDQNSTNFGQGLVFVKIDEAELAETEFFVEVWAVSDEKELNRCSLADICHGIDENPQQEPSRTRIFHSLSSPGRKLRMHMPDSSYRSGIPNLSFGSSQSWTLSNTLTDSSGTHTSIPSNTVSSLTSLKPISISPQTAPIVSPSTSTSTGS